MRKLIAIGIAALLIVGVAGVVGAATTDSTSSPFGFMPGWRWNQNSDATAQMPYGPGPMHGYGLEQAPIFGLELDEDQLEALNALREQHFAAMEDLRNEMWTNRDEYRAAVLENNAEEANEARQKMFELQQEMFQIRTQNWEDTQNKLGEILNDEQKEQLQNLQQERFQNGTPCGMGGRGFGPRGGGRGMGFGAQGFGPRGGK